MLQIIKESAFAARGIPFGALEVTFPDRALWEEAAFHSFVRRGLAALREEYAAYDRKAVFGNNPYARFFKKFKKTYPVMMQFESYLLKGRPFPDVNPITEIPFLIELQTQALLGSHDADRIEGPLTLFSGTEKAPFPGMRGAEAHTYPNDVCGRDDKNIILSMISGADDRTCVQQDSRRILYLIFGTEQTTAAQIAALQARLSQYVGVLSPEARTASYLL